MSDAKIRVGDGARQPCEPTAAALPFCQSQRRGALADPQLHQDLVTAPGESPNAWLYVLHGIYGAGRNWVTVARRLTAERPDWGVVLVDLRQHGASQGFAPPHTIAATAQDVLRLAEATGRPITGLLGHSFGGKVALEVARNAPASLVQVWIFDSSPDAGDPRGSAWAMLAHLKTLPPAFDSRDQAVQQLVARGTDAATAQWMATNLERFNGGLRWRFELPALEAMLQDFFRQDLWSVVERPPRHVRLHFVKASESSVVTAATAKRIEQANPGAGLRTLQGGHWLNADNPASVVSMLVQDLPHIQNSA